MTIVGVDITGDAIRLAYDGSDGDAKVAWHKLAFLKISKDHATDVLLKRYKSNHVRIGNDIYITGDEAVQLSTIFGKELYRPIKDGRLLNKTLIAALLAKLIEAAGITPTAMVYTVPAAPIDGSFDPAYRQIWLHSLLSAFCDNLRAVHTSQAVSFNELMDFDLTGITLDIGDETVNVSCAYMGIPALSFSLPYGASWIDDMVAKATGALPQLANRYRIVPDTSVPEEASLALAHYKAELLNRIVLDLFTHIENHKALPHYDKAVSLVIVGEALKSLDGASLAESLKVGFEALNIKLSTCKVETAELAHTSAAIGALLLGSGVDGNQSIAIEDQSE